MIRRELAPDEVAEIAALAAEFPDLRAIRPLVASLRGELEEARSINVDAYVIRPQSVKDLTLLLEQGIVTKEWVQARLPGRGGVPVVEVIQLQERILEARLREPDYVVKDKRVST